MTRPTLAQLRALPKVLGVSAGGRTALPWLRAYQGGARQPYWRMRSHGSAPGLDDYFVFVPQWWLLKHRRS